MFSERYLVRFVYCMVLSIGVVRFSVAEIRFTEVSSEAGIGHAGPSWGSAWGDFNDDGCPDGWVGNHTKYPNLYLNNCDGTFTDIASQVWFENPNADKHGAAWADFDNDGDQDLIELVARGSRPGSNHFYLNEGGQLVNKADDFRIDFPLARANTPSLLDWNKDGELDLIVNNHTYPSGIAPTTLFTQVVDDVRYFVNSNDEAGFYLDKSVGFGLLTDFSSDGIVDLLLAGSRFPQHLYDIQSVPFSDQRGVLPFPESRDIVDAVSADLNGDGWQDMYIVHGPMTSDVVQIGGTALEASIDPNNNASRGIKFRSSGSVTFDVYPYWRWTKSKIFIGIAGINPNTVPFTLAADDPDAIGMSGEPWDVSKTGVYIGFEPTTNFWTVMLPAGSKLANLVITSDAAIDSVTAIGFDPDALPPLDRVLFGGPAGYVDRTMESGITETSSGRSVIAADLDNDMDLDIYIVSTGRVVNQENILYENQGNGAFLKVPDGGGAAGNQLGRGDTVAVVDYDRDGYLDLFLTNGRSKPPFDADGPQQLFRNISPDQGDGNHWLEMDLEGVSSNRDGIGARISLTAGGITQIREQSGGMHYRTQNFQRLHFGTGANRRIGKIVVDWPSGISQIIRNVPADQILHVLEPQSGSLSGKPMYVASQNNGAYIWKDSYDGPYHVRVAGGGGDETAFDIELLSDRLLSNATGIDLEAGDQMVDRQYGLSFTSITSNDEDGFDVLLPPGANALLSVLQDGDANPRQLSIGSNNNRLAPSGWIINEDELPQRPGFQGGVDLGLFIGTGRSGKIEARWNSDDFRHEVDFFMLSATPFVSAQLRSVESHDSVSQTLNSVRVSGYVGGWWDGVDVKVDPAASIGIAYKQDDLFQPPYVNTSQDSLGTPNAYWLPTPDPYGEPERDLQSDRLVFLWKDQEENGIWHLRLTGGASGLQLSGKLSTQSIISGVRLIGADPPDMVTGNGTNELVFDFQINAGEEAGFDFTVDSNGSLSINLADPPGVLRIGEIRWPVDKLPLEIGSW